MDDPSGLLGCQHQRNTERTNTMAPLPMTQREADQLADEAAHAVKDVFAECGIHLEIAELEELNDYLATLLQRRAA
jgi:hypothetical protein